MAQLFWLISPLSEVTASQTDFFFVNLIFIIIPCVLVAHLKTCLSIFFKKKLKYKNEKLKSHNYTNYLMFVKRPRHFYFGLLVRSLLFFSPSNSQQCLLKAKKSCHKRFFIQKNNNSQLHKLYKNWKLIF